MSRTYYHSRRHGRNHRWANRPDRCGYGGSRDASESPNWYSHLHDIRPGRHHDRHIAHLTQAEILYGPALLPAGRRRDLLEL